MMADVNKKSQETRDSAMVRQNTNPAETTMRGSSSQQTGGQTGRETTTRGSSGMQSGSEMQESGRMLESMGTGRGTSDYAKSLCDREHAMSERERGVRTRARPRWGAPSRDGRIWAEARSRHRPTPAAEGSGHHFFQAGAAGPARFDSGTIDGSVGVSKRS